MYARIASRNEETEMTLNDARRVVKGVITACGGQPRTKRLADVFDALDQEVKDGTAVSQDMLDDFDTSDMEDYFAKPFTQGDCVADGCFGALATPGGTKPPAPQLETMTAFYTMYVFTDGGRA